MSDAEAFIQNLGINRSKVLLQYEAIILDKSLTLACQEINPVRQPASEEDVEAELPQTHGPQRGFQYYAKKLAEICMNTPGAKHITSVAVLQEPAGILYVFASNDRGTQQLDDLRRFVRSLFDTVNVADETFHTNTSRLSENLLHQILLFSITRVNVYLNGLDRELRNFVDIQKGPDHPINPHLTDLLPAIKNCKYLVLQISNKIPGSNAANKHIKSQSDFVNSMRKLVTDLRNIKRILGFIYDQNRFGNALSSWAEVQHYIGRILSYDNAAKSIIQAREAWPELFTTDVAFELIPSSAPMPNPFPPNRRKETAADLINRLFSNPSERAVCKEQAAHLEHMVELDKKIRDHLKNKDLRPIVHAEMLILDWMERTGRRLTPDRFFNGLQYIGSSKPTCRLCWLYFTSHPSGVQIRPTHHNIYPAWRMPDSYAAVDATAERDRLYVLDRMRDHLRQFCKRTLQDKQPRRKNHDSETSSSKPSVYPWIGVLDIPASSLGQVIDLQTADYPMSEWKMRRRLDTMPISSQRTSSLAPSTSSSDIQRGLAELSVEDGSSDSHVSPSTTSSGGSPRTSSDDGDSLASINSSRGDVTGVDEDSDDGGGVVLYKGRAGRGGKGGK